MDDLSMKTWSAHQLLWMASLISLDNVDLTFNGFIAETFHLSQIFHNATSVCYKVFYIFIDFVLCSDTSTSSVWTLRFVDICRS